MADPAADPDLKALTAALGAPEPTTAPNPVATAPSGGVADDPDLKALTAALAAPEKPVVAPAATPAPAGHVARPPTRFQQAVTHPPVAGHPAPVAVPEPELSWGQVGQQAVHNFLPSVAGIGTSLWNAATHPGDTLNAVGQLGSGAVSQVSGALGAHQDPAQKAKAEGLVKALEDHYAQTYGSTKGFKKALATDPASMMVDASMVLDPLAGALGKAGEAGKLGALSNAAVGASKAIPYVNPIKSAVALARIPGKALSNVGRGLGSVTSGVPLTALKIATEAGASPIPGVQEAFSRFANGQGDATEFANRAHAAMGQIRADASQAYLAGKAGLIDQPINLNNTYAALAKADADMAKGSPLGFKDAKARLGEIRQMVDSVANNPDPLARNLDNVDALKQQIYDLHTGNHADKAGMVTDNIYHGVKGDLVAADPEYAKLMESYTAGLRNTSDLTKTLGLKQNAAASATLAKNLKALKTGTGQNLLSQLIRKDPTIAGALAGAAVNPWSQHNSLWEAALGAGLPGVLAHPVGMAAAIPGAALGFAASSPRIVGSAANLAGRLSKPINFIASPAGQNVARGAYYASRANDEQDTLSHPPAAPVAAPSAVTPDTVFHKMIGTESGHRQFDNQGKVLTSPKGALGIAQIMPQTGPEAAALAGEEWSPERLKTDADYGLKLGYAYYKHLAERYGDPLLGAAAYNWGPGGLDRALTKYGDDWFAHAPVETQNYVRRAAAATGGRIARASGGRTTRTHEQLVERLMKLAKAAKRASNEATKPLLHVPDNVVAKALDVAQQAI